MSQSISEESREKLDRLECCTIFGRVIDSDVEFKKYQFDQTYPLRFQLRELSRLIWYEFLKDGKREQDILHGVYVVKRRFQDYLFPEKRRTGDAACRSSGFLLDEHRGQRQQLRPAETGEAETAVPPLRKWCVDTDITSGLELLEDDWLQHKDLWQVDQDWTWVHVYDFLALYTIDWALLNLEKGEPFKAAVAVARATDYHGTATSVRWSEATESAAISTLGKHGSDVRHSSNRAAKDEAIRHFLSRTWPSQAQAARVIGDIVKRTEKVVEKWIREYKKGSSSGTETA